jgi:Tfp pilus assembly protein PilN
MININLIAERRARKIREMNILRWGAIGIVLLAIIIIVFNMSAFYMYLLQKNELELVNQKIREIQPQYREWQAVQDEIGVRRPLVHLLQQVQKSEGAWMIVLADMSHILPSDVVLDAFNTAQNGQNVILNLSGHARDEKSVAAFMLALRQRTEWAGTPVLRSVTNELKDNVSTVRFEMTVPVNGLVGGNL